MGELVPQRLGRISERVTPRPPAMHHQAAEPWLCGPRGEGRQPLPSWGGNLRGTLKESHFDGDRQDTRGKGVKVAQARSLHESDPFQVGRQLRAGSISGWKR